MSRSLCCTMAMLLLLAGSVCAHGINGHINVTHWMTSDVESHRAWRSGDCRNAMVFGSSFPDTGYGVSHEYGELTHWPPFLEALISHLRDRHVNEGTQNHLAWCFTVGLAVHGLQDEIFDTFFLEQVDHHDGVEQDIVDPGLDAIMVVDGVAKVKPEIFVPKMDIISVLSEDFGLDVTPALLAEASRRVKLAVIDHFAPVAQAHAEAHRDSLGWASANYLGTDVVGSLTSEIQPTGAYGSAVWARLKGMPHDADIVSSFGGNSIALENEDALRVYGLVLSRGALVSSIRGGLKGRVVGSQVVEDFVVTPGIWTQGDDDYTRVVRIEVPQDRGLLDYEFQVPDHWQWIDGHPSTGKWHQLAVIYPASPLAPDVTFKNVANGVSCVVRAPKSGPLVTLLMCVILLWSGVRRLKS
jgi:hypothetical protein